MPRKLTAKQRAEAEQRFRTGLVDYFNRLGARQSDFYQLTLKTPAGLLRISVYGDWVATCFDNLELAKRFTASCGTPCNPFSGKWNFHFFDGTLASLDPDAAISHLAYFFDRLMAWKP
jgi:hypothetical protein